LFVIVIILSFTIATYLLERQTQHHGNDLLYMYINIKRQTAVNPNSPGRIYVSDRRDDSILVICDAFLSKKSSYKRKQSIA
jgi:hypothetical protein